MALIGDVEKAKELIANGEDENACDEDGRSVLYYGAGGGSKAMRKHRPHKIFISCFKILISIGVIVFSNTSRF